MGVYSWKYCDSKNRMMCGKRKDSFLLIPEEFGGGHIVEHCYNGYGMMGYMDVYEAVAEWNQKHISIDMVDVPDRRNWSDTGLGQDRYEMCMKYYEKECQRMQDYIDGKPERYMDEMYGSDWKREIGINIAGTNDLNARLKYPIKIAEKAESIYESCKASKKDPLQGCL